MFKVGTKVQARPGVLDRSAMCAGYRNQAGRVESVTPAPGIEGQEVVFVRFGDGKVLQFWKEELEIVRGED